MEKEVRFCPRCEQWKDTEDFAFSARNGRQTYCRPCNSAYKAEWIKTNRKRVQVNRLWSMYRLRPEDFDRMLEEQEGACFLCKKPFADTPCVDHDHRCCDGSTSCGRCVRALLCRWCNRLIGLVEYQGVEYEDRFISYLRSSEEEQAAFTRRVVVSESTGGTAA